MSTPAMAMQARDRRVGQTVEPKEEDIPFGVSIRFAGDIGAHIASGRCNRGVSDFEAVEGLGQPFPAPGLEVAGR